MNVPAVLGLFQRQFEAKLDVYFRKTRATFVHVSRFESDVFQILEGFVRRRGKRIRPFLVTLGYRSSGKPPSESAFGVGIALELLHTFGLIHDDIIDQARERRGEPALQYVYASKYRRRGNALHLGSSFALLIGDIAHGLADEQFFNTVAKHKSRSALTEIYLKMKRELLF